MSKRAVQFMPFNGLRGFEELLWERAQEKEERREPSEARLAKLNEIMSQLSNGMEAEITYFAAGRYEKKQGIVTARDVPFRKIRVDGDWISFDDIWEIQLLEE